MVTFSRETAYAYGQCCNWYLGGHEIREKRLEANVVQFTITSKGYYHYIGA